MLHLNSVPEEIQGAERRKITEKSVNCIIPKNWLTLRPMSETAEEGSEPLLCWADKTTAWTRPPWGGGAQVALAGLVQFALLS